MKEFDLPQLRISFQDKSQFWPAAVLVNTRSYHGDDEEFTVDDIEDLEKTIAALQEGLEYLKEASK